jgi:hypothetical protein
MNLTFEDRMRDLEIDLKSLGTALRDKNYRYSIGRIEAMVKTLMKVMGEIARTNWTKGMPS